MVFLEQFFLGALFLLVSLLIFTLPGMLFLKWLKVFLNDFWDRFTVTTTLGIVVFTVSAYLFSALNLKVLMWTFPLLGLLGIPGLNFSFKKTHFSSFKFPLLGVGIFFIGILGQLLVNAPSGFKYEDGLYFWSSHGHDGLWHVALMEEFKKNIFPFQNPELAGLRLQNYHFFVDLLMSEVSRLFAFSSLDVYFRFMPIVFSALMGLSSFILVREWTGKKNAGLWAAFFMYFCGSFGYVLTLVRNLKLNGETIFWISQPQSTIGNPPHAAAFIIVSVFLFGLLKFLKGGRNWFWILIALGGSVIEFKVYAGLLVLGGLLVIAFFELIFRKKTRLLVLFFGAAVLSAILYLPSSVDSQDFLVWQPWWYIRTMVVAPDRLNWLDMELRRQTYIAEHNWKRVIQLETEALLIFLIGNLGMRALGFWTICKALFRNVFKESSYFETYLLSVSVASFLIPVLFLQKGVAWNSIQFTQYTLLFFGFWAAVSTNEIIEKIKPKGIKSFVIIVILLLAVPTQIGLLQQFYSNLALAKISNNELEALKFLKTSTQKDAVILTAPFEKYISERYRPPVPIYSWYDTGYVPAISGRQTYLSDLEQVTIMGYAQSSRVEAVKEAFLSDKPDEVKEFLRSSNVDFVYLVYDQAFKVPVSELSLVPVFEGPIVRIYKNKQ